MAEDFYNDYNASIQGGYQKQLAELKRQQQAEALRLQAQADNQIRQYEAQKPVLKQRFTDSAQDAYVSKMNSLKEMPQVLAAQGYNGGLSESSNIKVDNQYGNAYNGHQRDYNAGLKDVDNQIANTRSSLADMLSQSSNQYGSMIANAESGYQQMLMQAAKEQQAYKLQEQARQQELAYKQQQDKIANDIARQKAQRQATSRAASGSKPAYLPTPHPRPKTNKDIQDIEIYNKVVKAVQLGAMTDSQAREILNSYGVEMEQEE